MKSRTVILRLALLLPLAFGCGKEGPSRIDDYFVEFATVINDGVAVRFQLDNRRILIPAAQGDFSNRKDRQRVVLNYTPLNGDTVKVNAAADVFTASVRTNGFPGEYSVDPVKIQSIWVGGSYLNMIVEVEYHAAAHTVALFLTELDETGGNNLYFSHSRNEDAPGYPSKSYMSFLLDELKDRAGTLPIDFTLHINTYDGMREIDLQIK